MEMDVDLYYEEQYQQTEVRWVTMERMIEMATCSLSSEEENEIRELFFSTEEWGNDILAAVRALLTHEQYEKLDRKIFS